MINVKYHYEQINNHQHRQEITDIHVYTDRRLLTKTLKMHQQLLTSEHELMTTEITTTKVDRVDPETEKAF